MTENQINCPHCGKKITITQAISHQIEDRLKTEFEDKLKAKDKELASARENLEKELEAKIQKRLEKENEEEIRKIKLDAQKKAEKALKEELKNKDDEVKELADKVEGFRKKEIQLAKKERELADALHEKDLEVQEKLTKEAKKIRLETQEKIEEEYKLKFAEKEKTITDLHKQMKEAQKKAEQGSMQLQGDVQEVELEEQLVKYFPEDEINPVKTGVKGGDIIQIVKTKSGNIVGKILWESKRTKNWSGGWLDKIKEDQRASQCDIAVIVTEVLPAEVKTAGLVDGVWVTDLKYSLAMGFALRENLKSINLVRQSSVNQTGKMEMIYNYLTGTQFKLRVEAIIESFSEMKDDLESERRAIERSWAKREKQIERFMKNMSGMYGDLQGLGAALPAVKTLELPES